MNLFINNPQKADIFASIFQHIKVFTEQINVLFEKDRMYVQSMDTSRVSIFEITIPAEWFDIYEHTHPTTITVGITSSILFRILNARGKTQKINLVYDESDQDKLSIHFTGDSKTEFDKHFELGLLDIENELLDIHDIESNAEFVLQSSNFATIINELKMFGTDLNIECSEEKILLCASSTEQGKMYVEIKIDDLSTYLINEGETVNISFSLTYLHNICLYNKIAKEMEIKISQNSPMQITFLLNGDEKAKMVFYLAPRVNDD